jgi:glutathionyl-hydroquinone reductase
MVAGLDLFIDHFEQYSGHYLLIGGSACDWHFQRRGLPFRAMKDIDMIMIVEALTNVF